MGVLRRIWRRPRVPRPVLVAASTVVAVGGLAACDPAGMSSASVAYTTDQTVTRELDRREAAVRWLTCTASFGDDGTTASADEDTVASVDCRGRTDDGKEITVDGKVTRVVDGACVRGDLTAKVDGKERFRVQGLGDCDATTAPPGSGPTRGQPGPTVTVTVTRTVWCDAYPDCRPVQGK
ncbi:hypothetical protein AB0L35_01105 [Streptomyces sp. NPDC052309]|uniref:Lipoprotein n=1 Tax=Streptomyces griseicoloratus TaxID=2752516 RepID=A0A926LEQ8_9ACTN|nr:hypothetical protein [Streptomyces griseicoloratus]MBD0425103.1 hypothetical protein [Streptomyces griseicoloratus]